LDDWENKGITLMKARMFWKISLAIVCLLSSPLLAQQFLETRILDLDGQGKYAEDGDAVAQYRAARCLEFGKKDMKEA